MRCCSRPGTIRGTSLITVCFTSPTKRATRWLHLGDPYIKLTPRHVLSHEKRDLLGDEYNWATWMQHPLSGYSLHFFHKAFEFGKLQGNYLVEMRDKPRVYTGGYTSPFDNRPGGIPQLLKNLQEAADNEFRPLVGQIGFKRPGDRE